MSEESMYRTETTEYNENDSAENVSPHAANGELSPEAQELAAVLEARRQVIQKKRLRKKRKTTIIMVLVFAALLTMCSREIVRLQAENHALKKQHAELEQERDRLTSELSSVADEEYIKEQARKQLRLLDPGEMLFVFEDEPVQKDENTD